MKKRISKSLRYKILERDNFKCCACGASNCLEIDHIIPLSKGGSNDASNLQVLCADCNRGKSDSMPAEYGVWAPVGVSIKKLEEEWNITRNALKGRARMLGIDLIRHSSTLTLWPFDQLELGRQLDEYIKLNKTSNGFYAKKTQTNLATCIDSSMDKSSSIPIAIQNNWSTKQAQDPGGLTFSEWSKRHSLARSTAYKIVHISGVKSRLLRVPYSRVPVAFFLPSQLQILDKIVGEFKKGKSLASIEKEAGKKQIVSKQDQNSLVFLINKNRSFLDQFMQLCALNAEELGTPEEETAHKAFHELLSWYIRQNDSPLETLLRNK